MIDTPIEVRAYLAEIGRRGGLSRSPKKRRAARKNAALGREFLMAFYQTSKPLREVTDRKP